VLFPKFVIGDAGPAGIRDSHEPNLSVLESSDYEREMMGYLRDAGYFSGEQYRAHVRVCARAMNVLTARNIVRCAR
jgi:hypothetical protein